MTEMQVLEVRRDAWSQTRIVEEPVQAALADGEVLFRIDRLALTSNNISYAASGDALGYWGFFPAGPGWGRIPAMGWADVVASASADVAVGERVWGFFPLATHLRIVAGKVSAASFSDVSAHRADYAPVYAQFQRASANPVYEPAREDQDSLLRGLFMTSWLVEDFLHENDSFGASTCLITSASSKTSIALAFAVKRRGRMLSIGITSDRNREFCESLDCYDRVVSYKEISELDAGQPAVLVDMAGSAAVLSDVHGHFAEELKYSCRVGATHYDEMGSLQGLPGPEPAFFFAPTHVQSRSAELGAGELMRQLGAAYMSFRRFCDSWLSIEQSFGSAAAERVYQSVLAGRADPAIGQIVSLWDVDVR